MQFSSENPSINTTFKNDVLQGLAAKPKFQNAKYFYDAHGDALFQKIMHCPEYYLTDCELEILKEQSEAILKKCMGSGEEHLDIVELGPGDAFKSIHLLRKLAKLQPSFSYFPIDISQNVIDNLSENIPKRVASIQMKGLVGEYMKMLDELKGNPETNGRKLVLFLGSSLGNMDFTEGLVFLKQLKAFLQPGDFLLMGLDLVKAPEIILNAYNDTGGLTKAFNLNLLTRINRELDGDFNISQFAHFPVFERSTNACKSYLISLIEQEVTVAGQKFRFEERETIYMEISQKYNDDNIHKMLEQTGFSLVQHFYDNKNWFVDTLWQA